MMSETPNLHVSENLNISKTKQDIEKLKTPLRLAWKCCSLVFKTESKIFSLQWYFNYSSSDMECGNDLAEGEKVLSIKEITKVKTSKSIAERMNRCVMKEICESVRIFRKILQRENLGLIAVV